MAVQVSSPSSPANLTYNAAQAPITADVSSGNVEAMVAVMCGENSKLNKEAQPTEKQQILARIEQSLSQSINSTDFEANIEFWESLKNSLPKGSPLLSFVTAQINLFTNNPDLQKLQTQYTSDLAQLEDALSKLQSIQNASKAVQDQIDEVQGEISSDEQDLKSTNDVGKMIVDAFKIAGLGIELGGLYTALGCVKYVAEEVAKWIYNPDGKQKTVDADEAAINAEKNIINAQSKSLNLENGGVASNVLNLAQQGNSTTQTQINQTEGIAKAFSGLASKLSQSSKA
jgi:hypothetical protein